MQLVAYGAPDNYLTGNTGCAQAANMRDSIMPLAEGELLYDPPPFPCDRKLRQVILALEALDTVHAHHTNAGTRTSR
jgi:hypothetical protein